MPKALSGTLRAAILADIRAAQHNGTSAGQIARDHGVARSTVTKLAADNGMADAFERTQTENAARAKQADNKMRRAQLASDLLADAQRFRERAWSAYQVAVSTPEGAEIVTLALPPLPDARAAYTAIGIAVDKSIRLEQHDSEDGGMSAVDAWLRGMLGETGG